MTRKKIVFTLLFCGLVLVGCAMVGPLMSDVEKPKYQVTSLADSIELRSYDPMIVAAVQVNGKRKEAIGEGFRILADYIFGNNTLEQNISMTAPVQQQKKSNFWTISFVMPKMYTLKTIPKPNNKAVILNEVPAQKFIVILSLIHI